MLAPLWRRPQVSPSPRMLEVDFRELETVGGLAHGFEALARFGAGVLLAAEEQAVALHFGAADAAAELVQLAQAEPLRAFDDDDRRVRARRCRLR